MPRPGSTGEMHLRRKPDSSSRKTGWRVAGIWTISRSTSGAINCEKVTPNASASFDKITVEGTVSQRSILDIIDRLTPDASASISSEKWFFLRK